MKRFLMLTLVLLVSLPAWAGDSWRADNFSTLAGSLVEVQYTYLVRAKGQPEPFTQVDVRSLGVVVNAEGLVLVQGDLLAHRYLWKTHDIRRPRNAQLRRQGGASIKAQLVGADPDRLLLYFKADALPGLVPFKVKRHGKQSAGVMFSAVSLLRGRPQLSLEEGMINAALSGRDPRALFRGITEATTLGSPALDASGRLLGLIAIYPDPTLRDQESSDEPLNSSLRRTAVGKVDGQAAVIPWSWLTPSISNPQKWEMPPHMDEESAEEDGSTPAQDPVALANGGPSLPYLGIRFQALTPALSRYWNLERFPGGVVAVNVDPDGPSHKVKIQNGDIILALNEVPIPVTSQSEFNRFLDMMHRFKPGNTVRLKVLRPGGKNPQPAVYTLTLAEKPMRASVAPLTYIEGPGLTLRPMTLDVRDILGLEDLPHPAPVVDSMDSGGWASWSGLHPGDVLLELDGHVLETPEQVKTLLETAMGVKRRAVLLLVRRGQVKHFVALRTGANLPTESN